GGRTLGLISAWRRSRALLVRFKLKDSGGRHLVRVERVAVDDGFERRTRLALGLNGTIQATSKGLVASHCREDLAGLRIQSNEGRLGPQLQTQTRQVVWPQLSRVVQHAHPQSRLFAYKIGRGKMRRVETFLQSQVDNAAQSSNCHNDLSRLVIAFFDGPHIDPVTSGGSRVRLAPKTATFQSVRWSQFLSLEVIVQATAQGSARLHLQLRIYGRVNRVPALSGLLPIDLIEE